MPIRFVDGFDYYQSSDLKQKYTEIFSGAATTGANVDTTIFRTGTGSAKFLQTTSGMGLRSTGYPTNTHYTLGFAFYTNALPFGTKVLASLNVEDLDTSGTLRAAVQLGLANTGVLRIFASGGSVAPTTSLGTASGNSTNTISPNQWYYIEMCVRANNSTGTIVVRVDGNTTPWVSNAACDTVPASVIGITGFSLGGINETSQTYPVMYVDDVYFGDLGANTFLGNVKVLTRIASSGNGSMTQFTPLTGVDHGAMVDDATLDSDTSYNYSSTANTIDTYNFAALNYESPVHGVQVTTLSRKTEPATMIVNPVVRINSNNYTGANTYLTTVYTNNGEIFQNNPETASTWRIAEIDTTEFGIKRTS